MKTVTIQAYQVFIRKLWERESFVYEAVARDEACIETFIKLLDKEYGIESIGSSFIYDYFCFQLNYWKDMDTRFGKKIPITWFIGKKAFERWKDNPEADLWHAHQTASEFGLHIGLLGEEVKQIDVLELKDSEENEKSRFHNNIAQLYHCLETTTLFNHNSEYCASCTYKEECKGLLKDNFYRVWLKRGYSEKNTSKTR